MKRIALLLLSSLIIVSCGTSKSVSYTHKPLAAEGCSVSYSAVSQDGQPVIVVSVKSDRLVFGDNPIMQLKNFKGEVLKLEGTNLQSRTETSGVLISNVVVPISELNALAQFPINAEDISFFESGIAKVRLSTIPIVHEKTFSRDQIGSYLYKALLKEQAAADDF